MATTMNSPSETALIIGSDGITVLKIQIKTF